MSQFLMCCSFKDLTEFQCRKLSQNIPNKDLYKKVANYFLKHANMDNIWVMEKSDNYFTKAQTILHQGGNFKSTYLFKLLDKICNICETMIFWYGSDFEALDVVVYKEELFLNVGESINDSMNECYLIFKKVIK